MKRPGARLVVTGCMAERYGDELAAALPEADSVVGFAGEGRSRRSCSGAASRPGCADLLELPRPAPTTPWAYVKVAEGCDRACAFCAIPSFRGKQRSRSIDSIEAEVRGLVDGGVTEIVLVAQDLAWYGRDIGEPGSLAPLLRRLDELAPRGLARVRLLYLYPSEVARPAARDDARARDRRPVLRPLVAARVGASAAQHEALGERRPVRRPHRPHPREEPEAAFRSSFIVGFPGETEADHDELLGFLARPPRLGRLLPVLARGRHAGCNAGRQVPEELVAERLRECSELQDPITQAARDALVGRHRRGAGGRGDDVAGCSSAGRTGRRPRSTGWCG